ncbi:hypothetical protein BXZ70DRAFT_911283 [Cristinia sonorae]|uniref:HMG box domain-containing protein n=1 Tax=Cristinia sonorae TaxID=1940300 RepID=A0A8K0UEM1_9AGAR|nr:hypothetical protein BXZ70DRAFT_911283 [Cristinia sonorae]
MFSLLARRVISRATLPATLNTATLPSRPFALVRPPIWSRTFIATASIADPAKSKAEAADGSAPKKKSGTTKTKPKRKPAAKKKPVAKAKKPKTVGTKSLPRPPQEHLPPKQPASIFAQFVTEYRRNETTKAATFDENTDVMKRAAAAYKELSAEELQRRAEEYQTRREEYKIRLAEYKEKTPPEVLIQVEKYKKQLAKKRRLRQEREGIPKRRTIPNAYLRFFTAFLKTDLKQHPSLLVAASEGGRLWRNMSESDKQPYVEQYEKAKQEAKDNVEA